VLEYSIRCIGGAPPQTLPLTFEFMTSVHSEMEFNPGRLEVEDVGVKHPGSDSEMHFVRVRHWPGESNGDTTFLMTHSSKVDGLSDGGGCALGSSGAQAWRSGLLALVAALVLGRARRRSLPSDTTAGSRSEVH
jgi:hypothetical protein